MKTSHSLLSLVVTALIVGGPAAVYAAETEETVTMDKVPAKVHTTLATYAKDSEVTKIEKGDEDGTKVFEFDITQGTRSYELAISKKGKYMGTEEDIQLTDMPDAVQTALKAQAGDGTLSGFEKATDKNQVVSYEADVTSKAGKKTEVTVDATGKVTGTEDASADKD